MKYPYQFRLKDFVPYCGLKNYEERNPTVIDQFTRDDDNDISIPGSMVLGAYNFVIFGGASAFVAYEAVKGLLSIIN